MAHDGTIPGSPRNAMNVALFDYGIGNIHSLAKAIEAGGARVGVETEAARALRYDALVLPGVGAFGAAAGTIAPLAPTLRAALAGGFPCLGICLGMQLLFDTSEEGPGMGIGFMQGHVRRMRARRVPHMGWNSFEKSAHDPIFSNLDDNVMYYANSFIVEPTSPADIIAVTEYGDERFVAAVRRNRTWGVQFHPEKSGATGLQLIRNFLRQVAA